MRAPGTRQLAGWNFSSASRRITVHGGGAIPNVAQRSWVSGCKYHYKAVLSAGVKAKAATNNLPIAPFVLAFRLDFITI